MSNSSSASAAGTIGTVPQPPTLTGDAQADAQSINDWMWNLYTVFNLQPGPLNPTTQTTPAPWDPNNLPSPENTTLASAQQTANLAWKFATLINNTLANPVTPPTPSST